MRTRIVVVLMFTLVSIGRAGTVTTDPNMPAASDVVGAQPSDTLEGTTDQTTVPDGETQTLGGGTPPGDDVSPGSSLNVPGSILNFQTDLFAGRFTYRVPIALPLGRGGSQPELALRYSSSAGNGWCGVGWLLDMDYIERETSAGVPRKWSGTSPLNEYDDAKGFAYWRGGEKVSLVYVGGANNNEYRVAVEQGAFSKFEYLNPSWKLTDKAGNEWYFGEATSSRMENPNFTAGLGKSTFRWGLNRIRDVNGNETTVAYTKDSNQMYLSQVSYNANINTPTLPSLHTVSFTLENRPDKAISFMSGYRVTTAKRLKEIQVRINTTNVRKYVLNYAASPSTYRSMLASVTEYGSDFLTTLPPVTFTYQQQAFEFNAATDWLPLVGYGGTTNTGWNSVRARTSLGRSYLDLADVDNDGRPDRVLRDWYREWDPEWQQWEYFLFLYYQANTGTNFTSIFPLHPVYTHNIMHEAWCSLRCNEAAATILELADITGDGVPDRFMRAYSSPYNTWTVQANLGGGLLSYAYNIGTITNESTAADWLSIRAAYPTNYVDLLDMNGDALPDRVARKLNSPYDRFKVQLNNGAGFNTLIDWASLDGQGQPNDTGWNSIRARASDGAVFVGMFDLNGDGLPDRVMRKLNSPYDNFVIQFNNGAGFEAAENWGPLNSQGQTTAGWNSPVGATGLSNTVTYSTLVDMNGDGLPDRVMRKSTSSYDRFKVQFNSGSGFTNSLTDWTGVASEAGGSSLSWNSVAAITNNQTYVDFVDMNGDGLPDRVMRKLNSPYDRYKVQLNKGPFPDLLSTIQNGIGGSVEVSYLPATRYDNRDGPSGASLLGYPFYTVSSIVVRDGFGNADTNTYTYAGGIGSAKVYGGFHRVTATDPRGTKTITYFHQNGGTNDAANGEFQDQSAQGKIGIPYRTELWGSDGQKYKQIINKVNEVLLHTNGWVFPFVAQTITMDYEGIGSYRATAKQFYYDASSNVVTSTGNLTNEVLLGEVTTVDIANHTFTDIGNDSVFTRVMYNAQSKPTNIAMFADSAGTIKLREMKLSYDARGNVTSKLNWLDATGSYVGGSIGYDQYGNVTSATNPVGIVSRTIYDTTYQMFPVTQIMATFTNQATFDERSGQIITSTDAKGLVSSNAFDVLYRLKETWISTNAYGACVLWRTKVDYNLGGVGGGVSTNYVRKRVFDAVDLTNGHETYTYFDGLGRVAQVRAEAETGQYRVVDTFYDERGNPEFVALPYFSSGTAFTTGGLSQLGTMTEYDAIGRANRTTSPANSSGQAQGDTGSPVGSTTIAFRDGSALWTTVRTDPEGKARKAVNDAYGRATQIVEINGAETYYTSFVYDKLGNLTNVMDNAGNNTWMSYDSLGRKTGMTEPNMGLWQYFYDAAGRLTNQTDAASRKIVFEYNDAIGRLSAKKLYSSVGSLQATITYQYDSSDDGNYTVFKGQLYKVTDRQGWQKNSYDVRGRVLKTGRYLSVNSQTYVVQSSYDDANRAYDVTYPGNVTRLRHTYDTGGNLQKVENLCGTGANETFYKAAGFNSLGQATGYTNGNGVVTGYSYFTNTKRLQRILTSNPGGGSHQDLSYTYDTVSNVKSINDAIYTGAASSSMTGVGYDGLHRLTSYTRNSTTYNFQYSAIGNVTVNPEFGAGSYTYGAGKPHAVTSANGKTYAYDACGNMTNRNGQVLIYDEENQLVQAGSVTFGYAEGGARLWKLSGGQYTIWIGGIYEIKAGKTLCHVFAGGKRIATFEPQGALCAFIQQHPVLASGSRILTTAVNWPLQDGRTPLTVTLIPLLGVLGVSVVSRRRHPQVRVIRVNVWVQIGSVVLIVALFFVTTVEVEAATYDPVFYYYHSDHLGSSNIIMDRSGALVDHYENTAFGKERYNEGTPAFALSHRFTGQILDEDTGLYYFNARYYDAELGRFIQPDTIVPDPGNPQSLNRYSYCNNNPLAYVDPSGHSLTGFMKKLLKDIGGLFGGIGDIIGGGLDSLISGAGGWIGGLIGGGIGEAITRGANNLGSALGQIARAPFDIARGITYAYTAELRIANPANPSGRKEVVFIGVGHTDEEAQQLANENGVPVAYTPTIGLIGDSAMYGWLKLTSGLGCQVVTQSAAFLASLPPGTSVSAHSGGTVVALLGWLSISPAERRNVTLDNNASPLGFIAWARGAIAAHTAGATVPSWHWNPLDPIAWTVPMPFPWALNLEDHSEARYRIWR